MYLLPLRSTLIAEHALQLTTKYHCGQWSPKRVHRPYLDLKSTLEHDSGPYESPRARPGGEICEGFERGPTLPNGGVHDLHQLISCQVLSTAYDLCASVRHTAQCVVDGDSPVHLLRMRTSAKIQRMHTPQKLGTHGRVVHSLKSIASTR